MSNSFKDKVEKYSALQSDRVKITDNYIAFFNDKEQLHREDGPALEWSNGNKIWFINGRYHREDGPAIEYAGGTKHWCLNDVRYGEEEYNIKIKEKYLK